MKVDEAKKRFEAVAKAKYIHKKISTEDAKARLRETDPGIDISDALKHANGGDLNLAGSALFLQTLNLEFVNYIFPLFAKGINSVLAPMLKKKQTEV